MSIGRKSSSCQLSVYFFAPLAFACSYSSKISAPAPSPKTKPSLSLSKGRDAVLGSSFLVDKACMALNPPIPAIVTAASEPPETIMSAKPILI